MLIIFNIYFYTIHLFDLIMQDIETRNLIPRPHYTNRILAGRDAPFIKVVTGLRRSGKSSIMELCRRKIVESGVPNDDVLFICFDDDSPDVPSNHRELTDYVQSMMEPGPGKYIFLDEIQNVDEWERTVSSLYIAGTDVYLTGSNSKMLSSELATKLSGRCIKVMVRPLVFSEYVRFRKKDDGSLLDDFIRYGGLPAVALSEDSVAESVIPEIISGTFNTAIIKDVVERHEVRNPSALSNLSRFLARNLGDRTSSRNISNYLVSKGIRISHVSIEDYISYLEETYLFSRARRMDSKTKEYLHTSDKIYCSDLGFVHSLVPVGSNDLDGVLENIVYNELLFRHRDVAVCSVDKYEVDFIVDPNDSPEYYQVCMSIDDEKTRERELRPLRMIQDNHPKTVIVWNPYITNDIDGIRIIGLTDWLLENE